MTWQLCENQSVAVLDHSMVERLECYLLGRETHLSHQIIRAVQLLEGIPSLERSAGLESIHLDEAIEEFSRRINRIAHATQKTFAHAEWEDMVYQINDSLWGYVEILEGCVTELFQQIDRIGFEQWNADLIHSATLMRDELTHRMDDLVWGVLKLEKQLRAYRRVCDISHGGWGVWGKINCIWKKLLDRSLITTVQKCRKFLIFRYGKFVARYTGYLQLGETAQQMMENLYEFRVLSSMDLDQQDKFKQLFFLLALWKMNNKAMVLSHNEVVRALRGCSSYDAIREIYKEYFSAIRTALFDKSRMIKKQFRLLFMDIKVRKPLLDSLSGYREELEVLYSTIHAYREFHFDTDPPKKTWRHRLFGTTANKQEAKHLRELKELLHAIGILELLAINFHSSMEHVPAMERKIIPSLQQKIGRVLHEMAQPLASRGLMYRDAKGLLAILKGLDEMGAFDPEVVNFIRMTFIRAMCADWKYHVLQGIPLFHHLYDIHRGICSVNDDRHHLNRLHKFQGVLERLKGWIDNNEMLQRAHEIELNIGDLKAYLQDFFAQVQHLTDMPVADEKSENDTINISEALLQYLYLFGKFFHTLNADNSEQRLIRRNLLFVDQYFEEIARKLLA